VAATFTVADDVNAKTVTMVMVLKTAAGGGDTEAPTAPSNLACDGTTSISNNCTWTASTDNVGAAGILPRLTFNTEAP
jgi:hypothetical protein